MLPSDLSFPISVLTTFRTVIRCGSSWLVYLQMPWWSASRSLGISPEYSKTDESISRTIYDRAVKTQRRVFYDTVLHTISLLSNVIRRVVE